MRYFDLFGQSAILIIAGFYIPFEFFTSNGPFAAVLIVQLFLGTWQMTSSAFSILFMAPYSKQKKLHFFSALIYLFLLAVVGNLTGGNLPDYLIVLGATVPAWILAGYYYYITWHWVFAKRRGEGKFLPNIFI